MKDVTLFLITFTVVMVAFASGVSYIFNMASGTDLQAQNGYSFVSIHFRVCLVSIINGTSQKQYHFGSLFVTDFIHEKAHYYCMNERRNRMYSTIDECY